MEERSEIKKVKYKIVREGAIPPVEGSEGAAFMDVTAATIDYDCENLNVICYTGLAFELPENTWMDCRPRSSIRKSNIILTNHAGVVDEDYRGEVQFSFKFINIPLYVAAAHDEYKRLLSIPATHLTNNNIKQINNLHVVIFTYMTNEFPYKLTARIGQVAIRDKQRVKYVETIQLSETKRGEGGHGSTGQ